jgi:hypothetical protein
MEINEAHEHAEVVHSDRKLAPISVTMAVLAVAVAAISLLGHRAHNEVLLAQMYANFQKAELVGKTTQRHADAVLVQLIDALHPQNASQATTLKQKVQREQERYAGQEEEIAAEERRLELESNQARRKANRFNLGELFCEMALVLSSITLLTRQRTFWHAGIGAGTLGVILALSAFLIR